MKLLPIVALALWTAVAPVRAQTLEPTSSPTDETDEAVIEQVGTTFAPGSAVALTRSEALQLIDDRVMPPGQFGVLDAVALQVDDGANFAILYQEGVGNEADVRQTGVSNLAVLAQYGVGNVTAMEQDGSYNLMGIRLEGDGNQLEMAQLGSDNVYVLDFVGSTTGAHSVTQLGDNNQLYQLGVGTAPFSVIQRGNSTLIIDHNGIGF